MDFTVGWEEWVALPDLGVPAVRAKVDTGAQTSSLHAFSVHRFTEGRTEKVRFGLHPLPERPDIEIYCEAELVGQREITSSNGETELRFIIATTAKVGDKTWPVEVSLTNRETMAYRMLLGRRALEAGIAVDVTRSCIQGEADLSVYAPLRHVAAAERALSIGVLTDRPSSVTVQRLVDAAEARGHKVGVVAVDSCYVSMTGGAAQVHLDGKDLPRFDSVLPFVAGRKDYPLAVLRQLEATGSRSFNGSVALAAAADRLHAHQVLARRGVPLPLTGFANSLRTHAHLIRLLGGTPLALKIIEGGQGRGMVVADTRKAAESVISALRGLDVHVLVQRYVNEAEGTALRCLVVGRKTVAAVKLGAADEGEARGVRRAKLTSEQRRVAGRAAAALNLQYAIVDLVRTEAGPAVIDVDPAGDLEIVEAAAGIDAAAAIVAHLEKRMGRIPAAVP